MTLAYLETVAAQLDLQFKQIMDAPPIPGKEVIKYTNAIEITAAMALTKQLITAEKQALLAPPGSTGPVL